MQLNMAIIKSDYESSKGWREVGKWIFAIGSFGLGGLYLWATTSVIKQGEIGLRCNGRGEMIILPPGRHSNFPWENYPIEPQSLSQKEINLGPYKIISVETGYVAKTFNQGRLEILQEGQHLLTEATHVFSSFIPVKQETKKLQAVTAYTSDNVGLTLHADVRYQIENPDQAIRQIDDIENSITEIAEISISQIVSHHKLADFAPATAHVSQVQEHGISEVIHELTANITEQLRKLGIKLLSIGITSWSINDADLAHELAQGAVIQSQTQSKMLSAEREAKITAISTQAETQATVMRARGEAEAILLKGDAIKTIARQFVGDPVAQGIYARAQQTELVKSATNPHLFFTQEVAGNSAQLPQVTLPLSVDNRIAANSTLKG